MTTAGIILAAGKGMRMKSNVAKPLHKVCGMTLVGHTVRIMRMAGIDEINVVVSPDLAESSELNEALPTDVQLAVQTEQLGTADAMISAKSSVLGHDSIVVAPADMVLVTADTVREMVELHSNSGAFATVLGAKVDDPAGLGRIKLDGDGSTERIVEEHECDDDLLASKLINTAWYCFSNDWVWSVLDSIEPATETDEVYLPRVVENAHQVGRSQAVVSQNKETGMGVNDRVQLANVESVLKQRINDLHMTNGVSLQDPASTYIDVDVEIGSDTSIAAGSHIEIGTRIGRGVEIGPGTRIRASEIGDGAVVDGARVQDSVVGAGAFVGSNALLRGGADIRNGAKVGNLSEIKNSVIGTGSSVSHFSYIGDATVGKNVNIGAGTVTCNYDGRDKHPTVIEDDALIGSSTMLVAPVKIGKAAKTGAGSVVRTDVMAGDTVAGVPAKSIKS